MESKIPNDSPPALDANSKPRRHQQADVKHARSKLKALVMPVGPVVFDTHVTYPGPAPDKVKCECEMRCSYGGGALNTSQAIRAVAGTVVPGFLIGRDHIGAAMKDELGDEFAWAQFAEGYKTSRQSIIFPNVTYTTRPSLDLTALPQHLSDAVRHATVMIASPMTAADEPFVAAVLSVANFSIWQPSLPQLRDRASVETLGKLATVTVVNHQEAREVTGEDDPTRAVMALVHLGILNPMVTFAEGVKARIKGQWASAPAHEVTARRTTGAGDCFTGVFAWAVAAGRSLDEALELGQAAAARHVTEQPPLGDLDQLAAWARSQPKVRLARRPERPAINVRRAISVAVGAAAMILAIALVW